MLSFDVPADAAYGGIRSELEAAGKPIGSNDLLIAVHACATGATIVTASTDEFKRIRPSLWLRAAAVPTMSVHVSVFT